MKGDPFNVVREFEAALCEYTGAPYAVTVTSCTMALLLAVAWHIKSKPLLINLPDYLKPARGIEAYRTHHVKTREERPTITIPKRTYVGVPMSIIHAGGQPNFRDQAWFAFYRLEPYPVWDSARFMTSGLYMYAGSMMCISFHHTKTLGLAGHGGAILHDNAEADEWLRRARFDGRSEGVAPKDDTFAHLGWHCYMTPAVAADGLMRLHSLPRHNDPLPNSDYPDLSQFDIFQ